MSVCPPLAPPVAGAGAALVVPVLAGAGLVVVADEVVLDEPPQPARARSPAASAATVAVGYLAA